MHCKNTIILRASIAPNGCHLRRAPEPNRSEGACGWSGAPQRRGTPSLSSTKLPDIQVNKYKRRSVSGRVRRSLDFYFH